MTAPAAPAKVREGRLPPALGRLVAIALAVAAAPLGMSALAAEPDHIRGQITEVDGSVMVVQTTDGDSLPVILPENVTTISLTKGSFTKVDFGVYVGAVAVQLNEYSPIVRDSLSWLHEAYEFRIIDEALRGIAVGHKEWDLTPESIIAHGWVDDIETRVLSIKYGPTEQEETDVEVGRDTPVHTMALGDPSLIQPGAHIFVGVNKNDDGDYVAAFVFVGEDGIVPSL